MYKDFTRGGISILPFFFLPRVRKTIVVEMSLSVLVRFSTFMYPAIMYRFSPYTTQKQKTTLANRLLSDRIVLAL
jgi:hypothetical protein